jgi:hypothetical protein
MRAVTMLLTAAHLVANTDAAPLDALARRALELAPSAPPEQLARAAHALVKLAHPSEAVLQGGRRAGAPGRRGEATGAGLFAYAGVALAAAGRV